MYEIIKFVRIYTEILLKYVLLLVIQHKFCTMQ
jgi:hypothetical protein